MKAVTQKIMNAKSVAVLTHIGEDPDALGSASAFCADLQAEIMPRKRLYAVAAPLSPSNVKLSLLR